MQSIHEIVAAELEGRIAISPGCSDVLAKMVVDAGPGDHVEIGTLWGGTAIIAALAKRMAGIPGRVFTIDTMGSGGFWTASGDPGADNKTPSPDIIKENLERLGVDDIVVPIRADSKTIPLPTIRPVSVFIDGDHEYPGAIADWKYAQKYCQRFIAFHDYLPEYAGVYKAVNEAASEYPNWKHVSTVEIMALFERVG